jgi:hypothetical protein
MEAHGRRKRPVEFSEPILPEPLNFHECRGRICNQGSNVDALAPWRERREVAHAARQHVNRAMVIQTSQMMERDADLKNPLVEKPDLTIFGPPQPFECFVLLEVLAAIELGNTLQQQKWWRFVTGRHHDSVSELIFGTGWHYSGSRSGSSPKHTGRRRAGAGRNSMDRSE